MKKHKWITRDGLHLRVGGRTWRWFRRNRKAIEGSNPAPIDPKHPGAPKPHPLPPAKPKHHKTPGTAAQRIVAYAIESLHYAGQMTYSEGADRSELFRRRPGYFKAAHADCSQLVAAILHWSGVSVVTDTDYTGSLLQKGRLIAKPKLGCVCIWGPGTGAHAAIYTGSGYVIGFGHQGAPDRTRLTDMDAYFQSVGQPGVRFLEFAA